MLLHCKDKLNFDNHQIFMPECMEFSSHSSVRRQNTTVRRFFRLKRKECDSFLNKMAGEIWEPGKIITYTIAENAQMGSL